MHSDETAASLRVIIIGTDALLEAHPATPIQLARACLRAGYDFVAPVSWGEELLATSVIEGMKAVRPPSSVIVHCPFVAEVLRETTEALPMCWRAVSPPVATARYLRSIFAPRVLHVTYAGRCPGATIPDLDASILPHVLFAQLLEAGAIPLEQPKYFEDLLPPDRARYASLPGGVPDPATLYGAAGARLREAAAATLRTVAFAFESHDPVVIDLEAASGCVCARDRFAAAQLEPPRANGPVVANGVHVDLTDARPLQPIGHPAAPDFRSPRAARPADQRPAPAAQPSPISSQPVTGEKLPIVSPPPADYSDFMDLVRALEPWMPVQPPADLDSGETPAPEVPAPERADVADDWFAPGELAAPESAGANVGADALDLGEPVAPSTPGDNAVPLPNAQDYPAAQDTDDAETRERRSRWWEAMRRTALGIVIVAGAIAGATVYF